MPIDANCLNTSAQGQEHRIARCAANANKRSLRQRAYILPGARRPADDLSFLAKLIDMCRRIKMEKTFDYKRGQDAVRRCLIEIASNCYIAQPAAFRLRSYVSQHLQASLDTLSAANLGRSRTSGSMRQRFVSERARHRIRITKLAVTQLKIAANLAYANASQSFTHHNLPAAAFASWRIAALKKGIRTSYSSVRVPFPLAPLRCVIRAIRQRSHRLMM